MSRREDESTIVHPEVFTLHWEGPEKVSPPPEVKFATRQEAEDAFFSEREREFQEIRRCERGEILWAQIEDEAKRRGDAELWSRKLHAYWWVKLKTRGNAGDYARQEDVNHATVRTWIRDVSKLAYQVGYRLHEDKLVLVGAAPVELQRLRQLVNRDASTPEAWAELHAVESRFRGRDPYFHLNEGHILRSRGRLRESDETLKEGLTIAEALPVRSLLWNARGQTLWDCEPGSDHPVPDPLEQAEQAFRRAVALDQSTYFPFVNLTQMAVDAGDTKRAEYWVGELGAVRKNMGEEMQDELAKYLDQAEWSGPVEGMRFWSSGPAKWIRQAMVRGIVPLLLLAMLVAAPLQHAAAYADEAPDRVAYGDSRPDEHPNSGAGGN